MKRNNKSIFILALVFISFKANSQSFAPAPGNIGTSAIKKDSSIIVGWANGIELKRGLMNKSNPSAGYASFGDKLDAEYDLLAGGGMKMGQVIGSTNRLGEVPQDRPIHYQEVFATLYNRLGIDVLNATIPDQAGRPQYLVDHRYPISELV